MANGLNPVCTFNRSPDQSSPPASPQPANNVNVYTAQWFVNGSAVGSPITITPTTSGDQGQYQFDFASSVPGVTLNPNDQVFCTVVADDTVDNFLSSVVTSNTVTEPAAPPPPPTPPAPPQNVQVTLQ